MVFVESVITVRRSISCGRRLLLNNDIIALVIRGNWLRRPLLTTVARWKWMAICSHSVLRRVVFAVCWCWVVLLIELGLRILADRLLSIAVFVGVLLMLRIVSTI